MKPTKKMKKTQPHQTPAPETSVLADRGQLATWMGVPTIQDRLARVTRATLLVSAMFDDADNVDPVELSVLECEAVRDVLREGSTDLAFLESALSDAGVLARLSPSDDQALVLEDLHELRLRKRVGGLV